MATEFEIGYILEGTGGKVEKIIVEANHIQEARDKVIREIPNVKKIESSKRVGN